MSNVANNKHSKYLDVFDPPKVNFGPRPSSFLFCFSSLSSLSACQHVSYHTRRSCPIANEYGIPRVVSALPPSLCLLFPPSSFLNVTFSQNLVDGRLFDSSFTTDSSNGCGFRSPSPPMQRIGWGEKKKAIFPDHDPPRCSWISDDEKEKKNPYRQKYILAIPS